MSANINTTFKIACEIKGEEHNLVVSPSEKCSYKEVRIPITKEQWDALRFSFATGHDDSNKGEVKSVALVYIK